jgi:hypothetical protein
MLATQEEQQREEFYNGRTTTRELFLLIRETVKDEDKVLSNRNDFLHHRENQNLHNSSIGLVIREVVFAAAVRLDHNRPQKFVWNGNEFINPETGSNKTHPITKKPRASKNKQQKAA